MVMTSGNLLNIEAYDKIGGFWEELFIDWVDMEYCLRLNKIHYRVIQINQVILNHPLGEISKHKLFKKTFYALNHSAKRRYYLTRNALHVLKKYKMEFPELVVFTRDIFIYSLKSIILFEKNKFYKLIMMFKGYCDYKNGVFGKISD
jgi:rhamnosyltransferase